MTSIIILAGTRSAEPLLRDGRYVVLPVAAQWDEIVRAVDFIITDRELCDSTVGLYGEGAGARAVLQAAAECSPNIGAVVAVSPGDVGPEVLERIRVPTLLVGDAPLDAPLHVHQYCERVPAGGREEVLGLAHAWFGRHLGAAQREPWMDAQNVE